MLLHLKRWFNGTCAAGTDQGLASFPIPDDSNLVQQQGEFKLVTATTVDVTDGAIYGVQAWLLITDDQADFADHDALWDSFVPKPVAGGSAALDIGQGADTTAAQEPGQVSITQIFNQEILSPERIFSREKLITLPDSPIGFIPESVPPTFFPSDRFSINSNRNYHAGGGDMGLVYGISSPDLAGVSSGDDDIMDPVISITGGFYVMKHLQEFIDKALVDLVGISEAGAETPYEDIMIWLIGMLERSGERSGAGAFTALTWNAIGKLTCGIKVPGTFDHRSIGPNGQAN